LLAFCATGRVLFKKHPKYLMKCIEFTCRGWQRTVASFKEMKDSIMGFGPPSASIDACSSDGCEEYDGGGGDGGTGGGGAGAGGCAGHDGGFGGGGGGGGGAPGTGRHRRGRGAGAGKRRMHSDSGSDAEFGVQKEAKYDEEEDLYQ
jgi:hypothetical protein